VFELTDRQWFLCALIPYGLSAIHSILLWRQGFRHHNRITYLLLLAGFALTTAAMLKRGLSVNHCPIHNLYEATTFVIWTITAAYLVLGLWGRLRFLGAFASPVLFAIGAFALMPGLDRAPGAQADLSMTWRSLHAGLAVLSYGAFGLAAVAGIMYLTQEHNLRFNKLQAILSLLPPIQRLELAMSGLLLAGFFVLSLGLAAAKGIQRPAGVNFFADPKVLWSILIWLLYFGLLVMRWRFHQRGRRLALGLVGMFAFVLLTFWGTALLSPLHNPAP
jgi:ABC-type transport system involved in cytochrome c biogenesis permease subunit